MTHGKRRRRFVFVDGKVPPGRYGVFVLVRGRYTRIGGITVTPDDPEAYNALVHAGYFPRLHIADVCEPWKIEIPDVGFVVAIPVVVYEPGRAPNGVGGRNVYRRSRAKCGVNLVLEEHAANDATGAA